MFLLFYLIFLIGTDCSHAAKIEQLLINSFYQRQLNNNIISPFVSAYKTLNKDIIGKITSIDPNSTPAAIKSLLNNLQCRFDPVPKQIRRASQGSERIRTSFEREENTLLQKINNQEKRIRLKEEQVNQTKIKLEHAEEKLKLDEKTERDYQQSADAAQREVDEAQKTVRENGNCRRKRRKRSLSSFLCDMFGGKGSENAHERLRLVLRQRHLMQHRLQLHKQTVKRQQFRYQTIVRERDDTITQLDILQSKLNQTRILFKGVTTFSKGIKEIGVYLAQVTGSSTVFKDQLMNLMDFEHIIDPLNQMYQEMIDNEWIDLKISMEITQSTSANLEQAKEIMKKWDVIIIEDDEMDAPCLSFDDDW